VAQVGKILVVGGGIAGLTTAAALHQSGFSTELIERQPTWSAPGAGFVVHANGMRMLRALGLDEGVVSAGTVVRRWQFYDAQGCLLSDTDLTAVWGEVGPCIGIVRPLLHSALSKGVGDVPCRFGLAVTSLMQDDRGVTVGFSDGTSRVYDLVVGADGIRSTVRALTLGPTPPKYLGAMNWRSIVPVCPAGLESALQMHVDDGRIFGLVTMGAGHTYSFAICIEPQFTIRWRDASSACLSASQTSARASRNISPRSSATTRSSVRPWSGCRSKKFTAAGWFWSVMPRTLARR
jgi:2-polyprenyl-6-methoxyphenol hydroxylase-like FAD-dependent oxidoreductase